MMLSILSFFKGNWINVLIPVFAFVVSAVMIMGSYTVGFENGSKKERFLTQAEQIKTQKKNQDKIIAKVADDNKKTEAAIKERDEVVRTVYVKDLETIRKLEAEKNQLRTQITQLQERVNQYVPTKNDSSDFMSYGAIGLLDSAAAGGRIEYAAPISQGGPGASTPAALAINQNSPSPITWRKFVAFELEVREKYNSARAQCNALIDWVQFNVVETKNKQ